MSREYLSALMQEFGGNITHAAERAGMERESLHRVIKHSGVLSDGFKRADSAGFRVAGSAHADTALAEVDVHPL